MTAGSSPSTVVGDDRLFYASHDGNAWSAVKVVPGVASSVGPALAVYGGKLYAAWKAQAMIPWVVTAVGPALVTYANKLYASWRGMSNDQALWCSTFNGTTWAPQHNIGGVASSRGPALGIGRATSSRCGRACRTISACGTRR